MEDVRAPQASVRDLEDALHTLEIVTSALIAALERQPANHKRLATVRNEVRQLKEVLAVREKGRRP